MNGFMTCIKEEKEEEVVVVVVVEDEEEELVDFCLKCHIVV